MILQEYFHLTNFSIKDNLQSQIERADSCENYLY